MRVRLLNRLAWFVAIAGISAATACSNPEPTPESAASVSEKTPTFRFAPPDGTQYVVIDKRKQELAVVGAPLRRVEEKELRWKINIEHKGDDYMVKQQLISAKFTRDGRILAEGQVPQPIAAELMIDSKGNLQEVRGLEQASQGLAKLVAPGMEADAEEIFNKDFLAYVVQSRYRVLYGETIGKESTPGTSWTITNPPGSTVASRTVTVAQHEACGTAECARLHVKFRMDPQAVTASAISLVKSRVVAAEGDPSKVTVKNATYSMSGLMMVEPATMLSHGVSLAEAGRVTITDATGQEVTVEIKGMTEMSYVYPTEKTSSLPGASEPPAGVAAVER